MRRAGAGRGTGRPEVAEVAEVAGVPTSVTSVTSVTSGSRDGWGPSPALPNLEAALALHFGHPAFREGQRQVIESVLSGAPTLGIMPTGAGKSLCYQLPALLLGGLTVVVSPLVALMHDQVQALARRGLAAACVHASQGEAERRDALHRLARGELRLLYVAPERFRSAPLQEALKGCRVELFAVDEAHCTSQWGHDFRPDYARLAEVRAQLGAPRVVALTATATPEVRADICRLLGLVAPRIFVAGFDRPNLHLAVLPCRGMQPRVATALALAQGGGAGIVYAATRRMVDRLTDALRDAGLPVAAYHAGLPAPVRTRSQEAWMRGRAQVVVATNAFGMGVDKPDVRFVLHAQVPKAVEAYYQEAGRAGRDGAPARAVLLFDPADIGVQERLLAGATPSPLLVRDLWNLIRFEPLVRGDPAGLAERLGSDPMRVDAALKLLERAGHLARGARGEGLAEVEVLDELSPTPGAGERLLGALRERPAGRQALFLEELTGRTGLALAQVRRGLEALARTGRIAYRAPAPGRAVAVLDLGLPAERLRVDFAAVARRVEVSRRLLQRMAGYATHTGCRRAYLLRYFGEEPGPCSGCDVCQARPVRPASEEASYEVTLALVQSGCSLEEVGRLRGLSETVVVAHLERALRAGRALALERLVPVERQRRIREVAAQRPGAQVGELVRVLGDATRAEVRLTLAVRG